MDPPPTEDLIQVPNRRDCEELCLSEAAFPCRSADYNILTLACALSRETRRTQTSAYANSRDHEYLENSCINTEELSCPYKRTDNAYPRYLDTIATRVNDDIDCEKQCTFFQDFVCRSFAFYASASQCFISGILPCRSFLPNFFCWKISTELTSVNHSSQGTTSTQRQQELSRVDPARITSSEAASPRFLPGRRRRTWSSTPGQLLARAKPRRPVRRDAAPLAGSNTRRQLVTSWSGEKTVILGKYKSKPTNWYEVCQPAYLIKFANQYIYSQSFFRASPYRLHSRRDGGITGECASRCQADNKCQGFNMDYNRNECQAVVETSEENLFNLRPSTGVAFFEAICLRGNSAIHHQEERCQSWNLAFLLSRRSSVIRVVSA